LPATLHIKATDLQSAAGIKLHKWYRGRESNPPSHLERVMT